MLRNLIFIYFNNIDNFDLVRLSKNIFIISINFFVACHIPSYRLADELVENRSIYSHWLQTFGRKGLERKLHIS